MKLSQNFDEQGMCLFMWQILRSCPDVASVHVLGREKKGNSLQQRFNDIFNSVLFDTVRKEHPLALEKVC